MSWLSPTGEEMAQAQCTNAKCFGMLLDGRAQATGIQKRGQDATLLLVMNAHHDVVKFTLPEVAEGKHRFCIGDTNAPERTPAPAFQFSHCYEVTGRSLLVFVLGRDQGQSRSPNEAVGLFSSEGQAFVPPGLMHPGDVVN